MNTIKQPTFNEITTLLKNNDLPHCDIKDVKLEYFYGYYSDNELEGIVGLEMYEDVALLRSLCVVSKSSGIGSKLLKHIDEIAKENKIKTLYLLTTTADKYFAKKEFSIIEKKLVPKSIKNTQEFNSICPDSAICMRKDI